MQPIIKDLIPGIEQAKYVQRKIRQAGIYDVQLFWSPPQRMWAVCQVFKSAGIIMPESFSEQGVKPLIMWWCKDENGQFRAPNENDIIDTIITAQKAQSAWDKGADWMEQQLINEERKKNAAHQKAFQEKIKAVSKPLKKAIREELR